MKNIAIEQVIHETLLIIINKRRFAAIGGETQNTDTDSDTETAPKPKDAMQLMLRMSINPALFQLLCSLLNNNLAAKQHLQQKLLNNRLSPSQANLMVALLARYAQKGYTQAQAALEDILEKAPATLRSSFMNTVKNVCRMNGDFSLSKQLEQKPEEELESRLRPNPFRMVPTPV